MQKQEKNPALFHQANVHAFFIRVLQGPDQDNPASALVVCVCGGGGGAGYVKFVMTGMCGPNFSYKLT